MYTYGSGTDIVAKLVPQRMLIIVAAEFRVWNHLIKLLAKRKYALAVSSTTSLATDSTGIWVDLQAYDTWICSTYAEKVNLDNISTWLESPRSLEIELSLTFTSLAPRPL